MPTAPSRPRALVGSPTTWHVLTLVGGGIYILVLQQGQWFFFDDFAFLKPGGPGLLDAPVGHWSTAPTVLFDLGVALFGIDSHLPFAVAITVLHLAVAHLIWRISRRAGADGWVATAAVAVFIVLGSGGENILWAFQIGFVGGLFWGLVSFLLAWDDSRSRGRWVASVVIGVFSLTWSGTAIPLVVATAALVWWKHGWRRGLTSAAVPGAIYVLWYTQFALEGGPDTGGLDPHKLAVLMPLFIGVMLILGFGSIIPGYVPGVAMVVATTVWALVTLRRRELRVAAGVPLLLLGAAAVFILLSAYSRAALSVGSGRSGRYIHLLVLLTIPVLTYAATRALARLPRALPVVVGLLLVLVSYQAVVLHTEAVRQSAIEQQTHRLLSAAYDLYEDDPGSVALGAHPDPRWAPDLTLGDLVDLAEDGKFTPIDYETEDAATAGLNVGTR